LFRLSFECEGTGNGEQGTARKKAGNNVAIAGYQFLHPPVRRQSSVWSSLAKMTFGEKCT